MTGHKRRKLERLHKQRARRNRKRERLALALRSPVDYPDVIAKRVALRELVRGVGRRQGMTLGIAPYDIVDEANGL